MANDVNNVHSINIGTKITTDNKPTPIRDNTSHLNHSNPITTAKFRQQQQQPPAAKIPSKQHQPEAENYTKHQENKNAENTENKAQQKQQQGIRKRHNETVNQTYDLLMPQGAGGKMIKYTWSWWGDHL